MGIVGKYQVARVLYLKVQKKINQKEINPTWSWCVVASQHKDKGSSRGPLENFDITVTLLSCSQTTWYGYLPNLIATTVTAMVWPPSQVNINSVELFGTIVHYDL
jgi:hypothetical protein